MQLLLCGLAMSDSSWLATELKQRPGAVAAMVELVGAPAIARSVRIVVTLLPAAVCPCVSVALATCPSSKQPAPKAP